MSKILLIHDTRTVGFLTGVVYSRLLHREGHEVTALFGHGTTKHAKDFWRIYAKTIDIESFNRIILCCVTFDDLDEQAVIKQCEHFEAKNRKLEILSHRWPDGYARIGRTVLVPPFELVERYGRILEPAERELLRISLIVSRQADPDLVTNQEICISDKIATAIWKKEDKHWKDFTQNPETALKKLKKELEATSSSLSKSKSLPIESQGEGYVLFNLQSAPRGHVEKTIADSLAENNMPPKTLGIGILQNTDNSTRAYIVRNWTPEPLPSVEYLLDEFAQEYKLPPGDKWIGPADARSLVFDRIGISQASVPTIRDALTMFAKQHGSTVVGQRRPVAGVAKALHDAAEKALASLDLLKTHTGPNEGLRFDPQRIRIAFDQSNRTGKLRSTLLLQLNAASASGAAFIYGFGGYNFIKLERLLEGVLIGMRERSSTWLECTKIPQRLRINIDLSDKARRELPNALRELREVQTISIPQAISSGMLIMNSPMFKALSSQLPGGTPKLVIFRESETVGPSIQYAKLVGHLAEEEGMKYSKEPTVLDLFAGSGTVAREVISRQKTWRVFSIDFSIAASDVGLNECNSQVVWLQGDVWKIIDGDDPILRQKFDIISIDPPHGLLVEIIFGGSGSKNASLLDSIKGKCKWLVLFQGHISQVGRSSLICEALSRHFGCVEEWHLGFEVIILAGPDKDCDEEAEGILKNLLNKLKNDGNKFGWDVRRIRHYPTNIQY